MFLLCIQKQNTGRKQNYFSFNSWLFWLHTHTSNKLKGFHLGYYFPFPSPLANSCFIRDHTHPNIHSSDTSLSDLSFYSLGVGTAFHLASLDVNSINSGKNTCSCYCTVVLLSHLFTFSVHTLWIYALCILHLFFSAVLSPHVGLMLPFIQCSLQTCVYICAGTVCICVL